jgi:hypothetical protein
MFAADTKLSKSFHKIARWDAGNKWKQGRTPQPSAVTVCVCLTLGFRRDVAENCALLGYHTASSGNV